jgi:mannose-6-phosphate isomerase-like protein (cupin superfamily)
MNKVNIAEKLSQITESWKPRILGELNGQELKLVKVRGTFLWHHHENEDELLLCLSGRLRIQFRDGFVEIGAGEFSIVPRELSIALRRMTKLTFLFSSQSAPVIPEM